MIKYKGYYIDNTCFKNKKEVDEFIENQAVNASKAHSPVCSAKYLTAFL